MRVRVKGEECVRASECEGVSLPCALAHSPHVCFCCSHLGLGIVPFSCIFFGCSCFL